MDCSVDGCIRRDYRAGLCTFHYEEERRRNAPLCKVDGCQRPSERVGMCNAHYRTQLRSVAPRCSVAGCGRAVQANGICSTHYRRMQRHGSLDADKRAHDRGARRRHPLYDSWRQYSRGNSLCSEWKDDFWAMVEVIGGRPSPKHWLRREDNKIPIGPNNWKWKEALPSKDRADYMREWRRRNVTRAKGYDLKRKYGIDYAEFERLAAVQNGRCAICQNQETACQSGELMARDLAVDHCHKTNKVRGLVCSSCNLLIGKYEANPTLLGRLVEYMHKHGSE